MDVYGSLAVQEPGDNEVKLRQLQTVSGLDFKVQCVQSPCCLSAAYSSLHPSAEECHFFLVLAKH